MFEVELGENKYQYIGFYKWAMYLGKTNKRRATCSTCQQPIEPGRGVWEKAKGYKATYIHIECAKQSIVKYGDLGFGESILMNLQARNLEPGPYSAEEVVAAIKEIKQTPHS